MLFTYSVLGWFCRGTLTGFLGGLMIGVILAWFEDVQRKWRFPTAIHWFLSIICSVFAWSLFCSDTLTEAVQTWGNLLGLSKDAVSYQDLYFLQSSPAVAVDCRILYKWLASFHSEVVEKANADCLDSDDYCSRGRCALFRAECTCNGKQCRSATVFPLVTVF